MTDLEEIERFKNIQKECLQIFIKKNNDYGKSYETHGLIGILIRSQDKINRLSTITKNSYNVNIEDETLKDTLLDLHNYSALALMLLESDDK